MQIYSWWCAALQQLLWLLVNGVKSIRNSTSASRPRSYKPTELLNNINNLPTSRPLKVRVPLSRLQILRIQCPVAEELHLKLMRLGQPFSRSLWSLSPYCITKWIWSHLTVVFFSWWKLGSSAKCQTRFFNSTDCITSTLISCQGKRKWLVDWISVFDTVFGTLQFQSRNAYPWCWLLISLLIYLVPYEKHDMEMLTSLKSWFSLEGGL